MSPKQHFGKRWEQRLVNELAHRGISANHASDDNWLSEFDIEAEGLLVHCKAARKRRHKNRTNGIWRNRYQFNFSMVTGGDFIIAICVVIGQPVFFIIPVWAVLQSGKRGLYVTSHPLEYAGWAAPYRNAWNLLEAQHGEML